MSLPNIKYTTINLAFTEGRVDKIENALLQDLKTEEEGEVLLDFEGLQFIQIEALIYLVAFIAKRKTQNKVTKIKYFTNESIRGFIHNCRFFETIKNVCSIDIKEIAIDLPPDFDNTEYAIDYFDKPRQKVVNGSFIPTSSKDRMDHLRNIGFYPLTSLNFDDDTQKSYTLKQEPKNWTESKPIISIIQKNIPEKVIIGNKISKHIIYESLTNAIRHPNSNKLVIACIKQHNFYNLVIWDNGESILDTLMRELKNGNSIKAEESQDDFHSCYCIEKEKKPGRPTIDNFDFFYSYDVPNLNEADENFQYRKSEKFVLLSSLFPGITRDPSGTDYAQSAVLNCEEKPPLTGRGLTYLINTAVRSFGGEVRIRTGQYFMNIKKAEKAFTTLPDLFVDNFGSQYYVIDYQSKYEQKKIEPRNKKIINTLFRATIKHLGAEHQSFLGNMITIQIPQR